MDLFGTYYKSKLLIGLVAIILGLLFYIYNTNLKIKAKTVKLDKQNYAILYIESSKKNLLLTPPYGDIYLADIIKKKRWRLTNDDYFDAYPTFDTFTNDMVKDTYNKSIITIKFFLSY